MEGLSLHTLLWIDALSLLGGITGTNLRMSELLAFMSTGNNWTIPCNYQLVLGMDDVEHRLQWYLLTLVSAGAQGQAPSRRTE